MTLSEVFYEAACDMSEYDDTAGWWSCSAVATNCRGHGIWPVNLYQELMAVRQSGHGYDDLTSDDVYSASRAVGWFGRDYRTFMLLMASEAVR